MLFGDIMQLPPVPSSDTELQQDKKFVFDASCWRRVTGEIVDAKLTRNIWTLHLNNRTTQPLLKDLLKFMREFVVPLQADNKFERRFAAADALLRLLHVPLYKRACVSAFARDGLLTKCKSL